MINQTTLINFSKASLVKKLSSHLFLSPDEIIHTQRINCPTCNRKCNYNGYSHEGNYSFLAKEEKTLFKIGQQNCPNCNKTYTFEFEEFEELNKTLECDLKNKIYSLLELGNSENDIKYHLESTEYIKISASYIKLIRKEFFDKVESSYPELDELTDKDLQGFYGYDEQYLTIDGVRHYRLVFLNLDTDEVIYEELHKSLSKKGLIKLLKQIFGDNKPKGFVFDMKTMYVNAFQQVFGKKINLQYCIFHLNKSILDKYKKAMSFLKKNLWTLEHTRRMYLLFNIFYDRTKELKLIKTFQIMRRNSFYFNILQQSNLEIKLSQIKFYNNYDLINYEKYLIKKFRKECHLLKLERKRVKGTKTLIRHTKEVIENNLDLALELAKMPQYFPKKVVSQLRKIKNNFSVYIGGIDEGIFTNNRLEGFFGVTLKKFQKKFFNVLKHFKAFLKLKKLRKLKKTLLKPRHREKYIFSLIFIQAFKQ